MVIKEKDFIEIEFTGKEKDGNIFDSNIKKDLEQIDPNTEAKPFVFRLGEGMFLKAIEEFLVNKEIGKYEIELSSEKAFGQRNPSLVQVVSMKVFKEQNVAPTPGAMFIFDGRPAKILTVSGGRVIADFNNPLAGKTVVYGIDVKRKVDDLNEKVKSLIDFFFKKELPFKIKDKKIMLQVEKSLEDYVKVFKEKFKDILGLELEIQETEENKSKKEN